MDANALVGNPVHPMVLRYRMNFVTRIRVGKK